MLEWAKQPGDEVQADETIVEISTDKVDAEVPVARLRHARRDPRPRPGTPWPSARCSGASRRPTGPPPRTAPAPAADRRAATRRRTPAPPRPPDGLRATPVARRVAAAHGIDLAAVQGTGPAGRIGKDDVLAAADGGADAATAPRPPTAGRRRPRRTRNGATAHQGRRGDARPLHGRVALRPDRDLVPHARRHDARRPPQAAQGGRPARSPSRTSSPTPSPARPRSRCR